jgi:hypothetical protein
MCFRRHFNRVQRESKKDNEINYMQDFQWQTANWDFTVCNSHSTNRAPKGILQIRVLNQIIKSTSILIESKHQRWPRASSTSIEGQFPLKKHLGLSVRLHTVENFPNYSSGCYGLLLASELIGKCERCSAKWFLIYLGAVEFEVGSGATTSHHYGMLDIKYYKAIRLEW